MARLYPPVDSGYVPVSSLSPELQRVVRHFGLADEDDMVLVQKQHAFAPGQARLVYSSTTKKAYDPSMLPPEEQHGEHP